MLNTLIFFFSRVLFLAAGICSILWVPSVQAQAAFLKDIRLGEYKSFTRIVFELDKAPSTTPAISGTPGELRVVFTQIAADLVRKIPIKQSPHVKAVQIWIEDNQLSAVFKVDAPFTHGKISSINNPPRLLVDVHWQAAAQRPLPSEASDLPPVQQDASPTGTSESSSTHRGTVDAPIISQEALELPAYPLPAGIADNEAHAGPVEENDPAMTSSPANDNHPPEASVLVPSEAKAVPPSENNSSILTPSSKSNSNRLQYYLVIGLVVLTIAILILLVFMLLTKYKWANSRLLFNIDDHLKEQQAKIETINGRIKEQLKHYEKA